MKTDLVIYQYLALGSEAFTILTGGMILPGPYQFSSPTIKDLERRIDAVFEPQDIDDPVFIVEFQAQSKPTAVYNLLTKIGMYGEGHPRRKIHGILLIPSKRVRAKKLPFADKNLPFQLSIVYLGNFLPALLKEQPDNPFVAVLAPLILKKLELKQQAPQLWQAVHKSKLPEQMRANLEQILEFWFLERFKNCNEQEILEMFQKLTPLEETRAYKSILAKGVLKGMAEGRVEGRVEGEVLVLKRLINRRFGTLPSWAEDKINAASTVQIEAWAEAIFDAKDIDGLLNTV